MGVDPAPMSKHSDDNRGRDQDRIFHVSAFYLDAQIRLVRRDHEWRIPDEGLDVRAGANHKDRDREM